MSLEWLKLGVKLTVMAGACGLIMTVAEKAGGGMEDWFARESAKACEADAEASGLRTKPIGTECYYLVEGRWIDIIDVAANADAAKTMKASFRAQLEDRAKAAIEARKPKTDFIPMVA